MILESQRTFQLWEYRVSHGGLLIRSPHASGASTNLDLRFVGVEYIQCPRFLKGLKLYEAVPEDDQDVCRGWPHGRQESRYFVIESGGRRHLVVAGGVHVEENTKDLFESPY